MRLVRRRQPVLVIVVAALCLAGCGRSSDQTNITDGPSRGQATTRAPETLTTEVVAPVESPGVDAKLVIGALPAGWAYSHESHSKGASGNPMTIKSYVGAPVDVKIPGGGQAHQTISVAAVWSPGYQSSGNDLRSLITPEAWEAIGYLDATEAKVGSRPALLLTVKSPVPPGSSSVSPLDYKLMFAIGDWWLQLSGESVDPQTLSAVAQAVEVR